MKRESGWYWVKLSECLDYVIRCYDSVSRKWYHYDRFVDDSYWAVIHKERIKSPEEK
jgi:hypothetical protein